MSEFKYPTEKVDYSNPNVLLDDTIRACRPLFEDSFDIEEQGGLLYDPANGQIIELRHKLWVGKRAPLSTRARKTAFRRLSDNNVVAKTGDYDPAAIPRGSESEVAVDYRGKPWPICPDGQTLVYPDGTTEPLEKHGFDAEMLGFMFEFSSNEQGAPIATTHEEYRTQLAARWLQVERFLETHNLTHSGLSLFPYAISPDDVSTLPYIQTAVPRILKSPAEFGVLSNQITMETRSPEAAFYALNEYQIVAAAISLVTQAAPIRDGRFTTTLAAHYGVAGQEAADEAAGNRKATYLPAHDLAFRPQYRDKPPHDWRECARAVGSKRAGSFQQPAPTSLLEYLRRADQYLREGGVVSARTLSEHGERYRSDIPAQQIPRMEVCNVGAGGNFYKITAAHELVVAFLAAKQLEYVQYTPAERQARANKHPQAMVYGHFNNIMTALHGRHAPTLLDIDGEPTNAISLLNSMVDYVQTEGPVKLSQASEYELRSTLVPDLAVAGIRQYTTPQEVFNRYFTPGSGMTATEALRLASETPCCRAMQEQQAVTYLLAEFSAARRQHVYALAKHMGLLASRT